MGGFITGARKSGAASARITFENVGAEKALAHFLTWALFLFTR
jgi:hypothetical protein